ncbi:sulfurtransferase TusA family protein [Cellulomonas sp. ACRRI]|uniref:sulfurtransferase TusA family protein n=1 Tax=Cellulomonas sp. ACRRI TaxID=2918188 RepID=UPI001EF2E990|nr:sulfurtransferase TusA family protein [Cellulomonas sp. ACRRI]MCG7287310.1 sulfurtransferase TusA family protein [Cellulomonas sp. ACRRI]
MLSEAGPEPVHVDGGDLGCARLLVLLRARARELPPGTVVHLTTSDPVAPIDLPAWCRMTGHRYLGPVPDGPPPATYAIEVAADARPTDPDRPWHVAPAP